MIIRSLTAAALSLLLAASPAFAQTVVIVRHGEKVSPNGDPDLSEAGQARAKALAASLSGSKVAMVLATPLKRTQQTGLPTAEVAGLKVVPIALDGGVAVHAQRVAEAARKAPADATVLIVGHSNTYTDIARALGDASPETLTDCEYDHMTVIQLGGTATKAIHARYGEPTKACP